MHDQEEQEPDFYRYTLDLTMARDPDEKVVYCDLVVAIFGANYHSKGNASVQLEIIPKHLLPAVRERR